MVTAYETYREESNKLYFLYDLGLSGEFLNEEHQKLLFTLEQEQKICKHEFLHYGQFIWCNICGEIKI